MFYDLIIIGGGPAGLTAGLYAGRGALKTLIIDRNQVGGTANIAPYVENYPGFDGIEGRELIRHFEEQVEQYVEIKEYTQVNSIEEAIGGLKVKTSKGDFDTKFIILSTGTVNKTLDAEGIKEFTGRGVSYCAVCDGSFFIDREVLVIGGGNSAATEALYLNKIGVKCAIVHRRDQLRCDAKLQEDLEKNNIKIYWDCEVKAVRGDVVLEEVVLYNKKTDTETVVKTSGVFIAIGHKPNNQLAIDLNLDLDDLGYIEVNERMLTSMPRVYAAGDITGQIKQIVVATGQGAIASSDLHSKLI